MTTELTGMYLPLTFEYKDKKTGESQLCTFFIHTHWIETGEIGDETTIRIIQPNNLFGVDIKAVLKSVTGSD